jgi:hypothetical protein
MQQLKLIPTPWLALCALYLAVPATAQSPNVVTHETVTTATVDQIDQSQRTVTLRTKDNTTQSLVVDPGVKEFDRLKAGDLVTVRWIESAVVKVRRDAKLSDVRDSTADAQKTDASVVQQLTAVVTVEDVDPQGLLVTYRTADGTKMTRPVPDKKLVQGLRHGDRVEVTLTRARAISIQPARR